MKLTYDGPATLRANELFTAVLHVRSDIDLPPGARVVLATRHVSDMGDPQMANPAAENFVVVTGAGTWELGPAVDWRRHPWNRGIDLHLVAGAFPAGQTLTVRLGDRAAGCPGYRCQSFMETAFHWRLGIDRTGEGEWTVLPADACPAVRIVGNACTGLQAFARRPTRADGTAEIRVKPEDAYGNVAGDVPASATVLAQETAPVGQVVLEPGEPAGVTVPVADPNTWQRLTVATDDGRFWDCTNPIGPSPMPGYELFFGEIHAQSGLCDGTNMPAELYAYARDAAGLDFAAVTSHDFELTAADWQVIRQAAADAHEPGRFVTFLGVEWSGRPQAGGDNNIYFLDDDGPLMYSAPYGPPPAWDPAAGEVTVNRDLAATVAELRRHGRPFMVVPHCGGRCANLDFHQADVMPLFEMHSCHRSYEEMAHETIRRGIRCGFIGGSDDHRGAMGDSHPAARERFFSSHNGLVAVYARELTRASLWEAFFARRVYATNGARLVLAVDVAGVPMGGDVTAAPGTELALTIRTWLDGMLDRVEIRCGTQLVQTLYGRGNQVLHWAGDVAVTATDEPQAHYVQVFQTDGRWACSSPIWICPPNWQ